MSDNSPQFPNVEAALRDLARLLKAVRYYPPTHPALAAAAVGARHSIARLLPREGHLLLTVRREGFRYGEQPVGAGHLVLNKLALHLFTRRVQSLVVLADAQERDLLAFARCVAMEPVKIQSQGGISELLENARVTTLWVNETDLNVIRARREEFEKEKEELPGEELEEELTRLFDSNQEGEPPDEEYDLETILKELQQADSDQRYRHLLTELENLVRATELDPYLLLEALLLLHRTMTGSEASALRRGLARQTLERLAVDEIYDLLADFLGEKDLAEETRRDIFRVLGVFPEKSIDRLMSRLATEKNLLARRFLIEALNSFGSAAVSKMSEYLHDDRWFMVRNAVAILGETRSQEAAVVLTPLLAHRDLRVSRETIRALTKIGGDHVLRILLPLVEGENQELSRQALLSLGAIKDPAAVPTLLNLVTRSDPLAKQVELKKGAIKALGEIGSPDAVPALTELLSRRRWWRRSQNDELRATAAAALAEIGGADAVAALRTAVDDPADIIARAAAQSLKQLRKSE